MAQEAGTGGTGGRTPLQSTNTNKNANNNTSKNVYSIKKQGGNLQDWLSNPPPGYRWTPGVGTQGPLPSIKPRPPQETPFISADQMIDQMPNAELLSPLERWMYKALPRVMERQVFGQPLGRWFEKFDNSWAGKMLNVIDVPAEGIERGLGFITQWKLAQEGTEEDRLAFENNLADAWYAGSLFADTTRLPKVKIGVDGEMLGVSIPAELPGAAALVEARRRISDLVDGGMDYNEALKITREEYYNNIGALAIRAQFQDMFQHIFLDPLNWAGPAFAKAFKLRPVELLQAKRIAAVTGKLDNLDDLVDIQRGFEAAGQVEDAAKVAERIASLQDAPRMTIGDKVAVWITGGDPFTPSKIMGSRWNPVALSPEARAFEMLTMVSDNADAYILSRYTDPETIMNVLQRARDGSLGAEFGHAFLTPEGRLAKTGIDAAQASAEDLFAKYMATRAEGEVIQQIAALLDENLEDVVRMFDEDKVPMLVERLSKVEGGGDIVPKITDEFIDIVKTFNKEKIPFTPELFKLHLSNAIRDATARLAVARFGVESRGLIMRFSHAMKSAETLAFLRLNPTFVAKNSINNWITSIARDVGGFVPERELDELIEAIGFVPHRYEQAFTIAGETMGVKMGVGEQVIIDALRGEKDMFTKIDSFFQKAGDKLPKWADMGNFATKAEAKASRRAFYHGYMQGWNRYFWKPGHGYSRISQVVPADILETIPTHIQKLIEDVIGSAMNENELAVLTAGKNLNLNAKAIVDDVIREYGYDLNQRMPAPFMEKLNRQLTEAMPQGTTAVRKVIDNARETVQSHLDDLASGRHQSRIDELATITEAGYPTSLLTIWGDALDEFHGGVLAHDIRYSKLEPTRLTGELADIFWKRTKGDAEKFWSRQWGRLDEVLAGVEQAGDRMGVKIPKGLRTNFKKWSGGWKKYINNRNRLHDQFFEAILAKKKPPREWADIQAILEDEYKAMLELEYDLTQNMDDLLVKMVQDNRPDVANAFAAWRKRARELRVTDREDLAAFRRSIDNLSPKGKEEAWRQFWTDRQKPHTDLWKTERAGVAALSGDQKAADGLNGLDDMTGASRENALRAIADMYGIQGADETNIPINEAIVGIVNKYLNGEYEGVANTTLAEARRYIDQLPKEQLDELAAFSRNEGIDLEEYVVGIIDRVKADLEAAAPKAPEVPTAAPVVPEGIQPPTPFKSQEITDWWDELTDEGRTQLVDYAESRGQDLEEYLQSELNRFDEVLGTDEAEELVEAAATSELVDDAAELVLEPPKTFTKSVDGTTYAYGLDPNTRYEFEFQVKELDDIIPSHTDDLKPTPGYPQELQPRGRERVASDTQINRIANELNPEWLLYDTRQLETGPMIIGPDNFVEAGNGRVMALRRAAESNPENWAAYQDELRKILPEYGLDPANIEGMKNPVLVRMRKTDVDRAKFALESNPKRTMGYSTMEQALIDANLIGDEVVAGLSVPKTGALDAILNSTENRKAIRAWLEKVPLEEQAGLLDKSGNLSRAGIDRFRSALFARTFPGEAGAKLVAIFTENVDDVGIRNIENALTGALPDLAKFEAGVALGKYPQDLSISDDIAKAVDFYARLKDQGLPVSSYLKQGSFVGRELDEFQDILLQYLNDNIRSYKRIKEMIAAYVERASKEAPAAQGALFDGVRLTKKEALADAIKQLEPEELPLFTKMVEGAEAPRPDIEITPAQAARGGLEEPTPGLVEGVGGVTEEAGAGQAPQPEGAAGGIELPEGLNVEQAIRQYRTKYSTTKGQQVYAELPDGSIYAVTPSQDIDAFTVLATIEGTPADEISIDVIDRLRSAHTNEIIWEKSPGAAPEGAAVPAPEVPTPAEVPQGPAPREYENLADIPPSLADEAFEARRQYRGEPEPDRMAFGEPPEPGTELTSIVDTDDLLSGYAAGNPPTDVVEDQHWFSRGLASLDDIEAQAVERINRPPVSLDDLTPEQTAEVNKYLRMVEGQMADARVASVRYGEFKRDSALLNYNRRYNYNNWFSVIWPFEFWTTQSLAKWAIHSIDRPAMLTSYLRLKKFIETAGMEQNGFPSRLQGSLKIELPFLPDFMGKKFFVNPLQWALPFDGWASGYEQYQTEMQSEEGRAVRLIANQLDKGEISQAEADEAINTRAGSTWENALAQTRVNDYEGRSDGWDYASMLLSPHAPYVWAKELLIDKTPEEMGPFLPISRTFKQAAGLLGIDTAHSKYNVAGNIRKQLGLPAFDQWDDYRVDRELSNMAADGYNITDIKMSMINRSGPLWEEAMQRAAKAYSGGGLIPFITKVLGVPTQTYPVGEEHQRTLQDEFNKAYESYDSGNVDALTKFFEAYPEYETRLALWDEPEERLHQFLVDNIWDRYHELPSVHKWQIEDALGPEYQQFVSSNHKGTGITNEQLQTWLKLMGGDPPGSLNSPTQPLELADADEAWRVQQFYELRGSLFPHYKELQDTYFKLSDQDKDNIGEMYAQIESELGDVGAMWDQYWKLKEEGGDWRGYYQKNKKTFKRYFEIKENFDRVITPSARKQFFRDNPELGSYWDWRRDFFHRNPAIVPYLDDDFEFEYESVEDIPTETNIPVYTFEEWSYVLGSRSVANVVVNGDIPETATPYLEDIADQLGITIDDLIALVGESAR